MSALLDAAEHFLQGTQLSLLTEYIENDDPTPQQTQEILPTLFQLYSRAIVDESHAEAASMIQNLIQSRFTELCAAITRSQDTISSLSSLFHEYSSAIAMTSDSLKGTASYFNERQQAIIAGTPIDTISIENVQEFAGSTEASRASPELQTVIPQIPKNPPTDYEMSVKLAATDPIEARKYLEKACEAGDPIAVFQMAKTKSDPQLLSRAAELGNSDAQFELGYKLEISGTTKEDREQAAQWFKKSADNGNPRGIYWYGLCLKNGSGVERNLDLAYTYFERASAAGNDAATVVLHQMSAESANVK